MDTPSDAENEREKQLNPKKAQLTNEHRAAIAQALLEQSTDKILKRGTIIKVSRQFNINRAAIRRVRKQAL